MLGNGSDWRSPGKATGVAVKSALPKYPSGSLGFILNRPSVAIYNLVGWSSGRQRALDTQRHICAARASYVVKFAVSSSFFDLTFRVLSCSRVISNVAVEMFSNSEGEVGFFRNGGGSYSMWWNLGEGGMWALSKVRSKNGGAIVVSPRAILAHVLIKWSAETPSANVWCKPTPRAVHSRLKCVTCVYSK